MPGSEFCPKCGKTEGKFIQNFCQSCFLEDHDLLSVPPEIPVEYCTRCMRIKVRGQWIVQKEVDLAKIVLTHLKLKELLQATTDVVLTPQEDGKTTALILVKGKLGSGIVELEKEVTLLPKKGYCESCSKMASGYFEATLQIRWKDATKAEALIPGVELFAKDFLERNSEKDPLSFLAKKTVTVHGLDYYLGSKTAAKKLARLFVVKYDGELITSFKLHTQVKNEVIKRLTYCVRI